MTAADKATLAFALLLALMLPTCGGCGRESGPSVLYSMQQRIGRL